MSSEIAGTAIGDAGNPNGHHPASVRAAAASASTSSTSTSKRTNQPTLDALTASLQSSEIGVSTETHFRHQIDALSYKTLLSGQDERAVVEERDKTRSSASAQLHDLLLDRVLSQGGEVIFLLGRRRASRAKTEGSGNVQAEASTASQTLSEEDVLDVKEVEHIDTHFTPDEIERSIANLEKAASHVTCQASVLLQSSREDGQTQSSAYAFVLVRRIPANAQELLELRVAVIGNVDAGKSSTLGVLTRGGLDDGRGKARVNLFRHKHEIESGRTSSVGMEIMGFDTRGQVVMNSESKSASEPGRKLSWEDVCAKSAKVISFIDLAGHERYLKTTVGGLTGCLPDFVMLMVGANAGLIGMSKEHLGVALALAVPVLVCVTKIDMTPPHILEATIKQLTKILRSPGCRKTPVFVDSLEQAVESALRLGHERICPVFQISNVTGHHLDLLRSFLNVLPQADQAKFSPEAPFKFQLQDVFSVPFVGCVVSGVILSGVVRVGDNLIIGPDSLGQFTNTSVRSIQRKRVNVDVASAGQSASFALKKIRKSQVRKGMVMLPKIAEGQPAPRAVMTCDAEILCLYHSTTLSVGSCMVLHAASIRQTVKIVQIAKLDAHGTIVSSSWPAAKSSSTTEGQSEEGGGAAKNRRLTEQQQRKAAAAATRHMNAYQSNSSTDKPVVRTGDRALLRLQFIRTAEYLEPGLKLITREGKTKLIGVVRAVGQTGPLTSDILPNEQTTKSTDANDVDGSATQRRNATHTTDSTRRVLST